MSLTEMPRRGSEVDPSPATSQSLGTRGGSGRLGAVAMGGSIRPDEEEPTEPYAFQRSQWN
jgi:hypothetical protein